MALLVTDARILRGLSGCDGTHPRAAPGLLAARLLEHQLPGASVLADDEP
ncbi:hypothetical protein [Streptomyces sp. NPDC001292]